MLCGDKEREGLTGFIHGVSKQGKPHKDLWVNKVTLGTSKKAHATFTSNPVISIFFFILERNLQYSAVV